MLWGWPLRQPCRRVRVPQGGCGLQCLWPDEVTSLRRLALEGRALKDLLLFAHLVEAGKWNTVCRGRSCAGRPTRIGGGGGFRGSFPLPSTRGTARKERKRKSLSRVQSQVSQDTRGSCDVAGCGKCGQGGRALCSSPPPSHSRRRGGWSSCVCLPQHEKGPERGGDQLVWRTSACTSSPYRQGVIGCSLSASSRPLQGCRRGICNNCVQCWLPFAASVVF